MKGETTVIMNRAHRPMISQDYDIIDDRCMVSAMYHTEYCGEHPMKWPMIS
jgi:hypothetical protein